MKLTNAIKWDRPCYKCRSDFCDLSCSVQPVQEPTPWRDMVVVSLVREGINKHKARELADHFAAQPKQEPAHGDIRALKHRIHGLEGELIGYKKIIADLEAEREPVQKPAACRFCHDARGCWAWQCYHCGEIDDVQKPIPPAAQRPWVGLTEQDMPSGEDPMFDHQYFIAGMVYAAKVLQDKNHG